ncbi:Rieske 2Fe-2S domain-containing protein [Arthrobacter wenxiniae]|nr:Rieske 2Fe-2S domain-containing protein [Arthrobacter wenxiniae]
MMRTLLPFRALNTLENVEYLDGLIALVQRAARGVIGRGAAKDVLHGVPMGHPLHPLAVQLPIGAWTSAVVLDIVPGAQRSSEALLAIGIVSALPAMAAGWTDWAELHPQQQRVGLVHAAANVSGTLLFAMSWVLRRQGHQSRGAAVSAAALATITLGGTLGGHLAYRLAAGANHAEEVPHLVAPGWQGLAKLADLPVEKLEKRALGDVPLLVWRSASGSVSVLSNKCSHLAGPLDEGVVMSPGPNPCVECPWHHSRFSLATGEVVQGPATSPQAAFKTRVVGGVVEICLPHAG